jgi:hypothetical protein
MAPKAKKKRFTLDTAAFVTLWRNHLNLKSKAGEDVWRKFVMNAFDRFTGGNELGNQAYLLEVDRNWKKWSADAKYAFLSEKCYSKAIIIKRNLAKGENGGHNVELPQGYKTRNGPGSTKRVTTEDIWNIFSGKVQ